MDNTGILTQHVNRSVTRRQREILQLYVDDVEGRNPGPSPSTSRTDSVKSDDSPKANGEADTPLDDNGTASFAYPSPLPEDGWISRATKRIRGLIGF